MIGSKRFCLQSLAFAAAARLARRVSVVVVLASETSSKSTTRDGGVVWGTFSLPGAWCSKERRFREMTK